MALPPVVNPIGVELDETARRMRIRWDDGHLGEWSWTALRRACPCALCAGEGSLPGVVTLETVFDERQTTMNEVRWIGRYALAPIWADGHDTGLFTYTKLRELCECAEHAGSPDR
jgi:DUF971 family protein